MKKRTIAGGLVVGAVVFSMFSFDMFPGMGTSNGDNTSDNTDVDTSNTQVSAQDPGNTQNVSQTKDDKKDAVDKPKKPEPVPETKMVELIVHASGIGIGYTDGKYRGASLEEAVKLAMKATGNEDGIKVRIMRDVDGRLALWSRLEEELHLAGIKSDEIVTPRELLDLNKKKRDAAKKASEEKDAKG
jgi:hypothetical protein